MIVRNTLAGIKKLQPALLHARTMPPGESISHYRFNVVFDSQIKRIGNTFG